ncbi:Gfo/Idh/MocA family protein [Nocardia transvalensis]|uniref:Gfo/Idh/MocA family protein n=1 Tax=Nocardia transvalensis TaxID=37333 RepID=UPI0018930F97|nr:Gfo/Idh/MocA family oxidoreductase [Nocardia transvalensis]MBF6328268.1 Gfo/Idh/MocA family oxidoreductase [Nocardia transvalensis]
MTDPVRLGILGCADIALRKIIPAATTLPHIDIAAVASRRPRVAREVAERYGCRPMPDYDKLIADESIDAVYIPLPSGLHAPWIMRALDAGKHVLAEKPLTTSLDSSIAAVDAAVRADLVLRENFMFLHHSQHQRVRSFIVAGEIGDLRAMTAAFTIPRRPTTDFRYDATLGGGARFDTGVYPMRAASFFLGDLSVIAAAEVIDETVGVDIEGEALLRADDGVDVHLTYGLDHTYASRYELFGTTGRITVDRAFTPPADYPPTVVINDRHGSRTVALEPDDQCANSLSAFATDIRTGNIVDPGIIRQARLLDAVGRSSGSRGTPDRCGAR